MPRLAACHMCKLLQRFPDVPKDTPLVPARIEYTSGEEYVFKDDKGHPVMVPAYDPAMEDFIERHGHGLTDDQQISGVIQVWGVDEKTWKAVDVVQQIKGELHDQTNSWYEDRDTYREAAVECYNAHGNPDISTGCRDYLDDSKRIGTATYKVEGKTMTVPPNLRLYLCYMCPYQQAYVNVELRRKKGMYKGWKGAPG